MTTATLQKKMEELLPGGKSSYEELAKQVLFSQLQEISRKIAVFEGKYNQGFEEFKKSWKQKNRKEKFSYDTESDYQDWEALDEYKRELMQALHVLRE